MLLSELLFNMHTLAVQTAAALPAVLLSLVSASAPDADVYLTAAAVAALLVRRNHRRLSGQLAVRRH